MRQLSELPSGFASSLRVMLRCWPGPQGYLLLSPTLVRVGLLMCIAIISQASAA
jgi:hypothetical protein|tara:strand:- start:20086 stop:20247 length:162 start_codon:yes stop_codon:yes gene_type:complete